ncbi:unnamed protein product [Echinostoma caproni]|uniref:BPTI/Kunitz inhibitor domain-containing protein n=1 Tax=Echinostoma caproni TaxID=27848 RepID=A0A183ALU4_9TREM|nr:unnamed protein product [Echinostoma caproni]
MLRPEPGNCRAAITRYAFNRATNKCEEFIYGGCGGNENNFKTKFDCELACIYCAHRRPWEYTNRSVFEVTNCRCTSDEDQQQVGKIENLRTGTLRNWKGSGVLGGSLLRTASITATV